MAVLRAEIQRETKKLSTPNLWAKNIPPPTVTMQTGHCACIGETRNKKQEIRNKKDNKSMSYFTRLFEEDFLSKSRSRIRTYTTKAITKKSIKTEIK